MQKFFSWCGRRGPTLVAIALATLALARTSCQGQALHVSVLRNIELDREVTNLRSGQAQLQLQVARLEQENDGLWELLPEACPAVTPPGRKITIVRQVAAAPVAATDDAPAECECITAAELLAGLAKKADKGHEHPEPDADPRVALQERQIRELSSRGDALDGRVTKLEHGVDVRVHFVESEVKARADKGR